MIELLVIVGVLGGGAALVAALNPPKVPDAPPPPPQCAKGSLAAWAGRGASASATGAATGAPAGGVGAGVGAGVGLAASLAADKCAQSEIAKKIADAQKLACKKADELVAEIRKKGGAVPKGYYTMNCDQRLAAALAAASPFGIVLAGGAVVVQTVADGVSHAADEGKKVLGKVGL